MQKKLAPASVPASLPARSPSKIQAIGIVIPAHNHAESIVKCIASIFAANSFSGWHNSLWIVVIADRCTDDTAKVAREALGAFGEVLEVSASSLQTAHRIGISALLEHFRDVPRHALFTARADAAAKLTRDWIDQQLQCHVRSNH